MTFTQQCLRSLKRHAFLALVALVAALSPAAAEGPDQDRIRALEARVAELEQTLRRLDEAGRAPESIAELRRQIDLLAAEIEKLRIGSSSVEGELESVHGLGPAASRVYGISEGVSIGGYGEMLYQSFDSSDESGNPSGKTDQLDLLRGILYFGYKFSDRILFNTEVEFEHASTGKGGEVSLEFAYMDFLLSEKANVRAGLVLVPAGFINELHEPPIFLGARRPEVESRIIPSTWRENGVGLFGDLGPVSYRGYLLTGFDSSGFNASQSLRGGRQKGAKAAAEDFAVAIRADYNIRPGLTAGGFFYQGEADQSRLAPAGFSVDPNGTPIPNAPTTSFDAKVTLYDLHVEYRARGWELRGLYAAGKLDDAKRVNDANGLTGTDSVGEEFFGWYAQAGYDVLAGRSGASGQALIPYVRYESLNTQDAVPGESPQPVSASSSPAPYAADPANEMTVLTAGIAYKPLFNVSIKADYSVFKNEAETGVDQISIALGYLF